MAGAQGELIGISIARDLRLPAVSLRLIVICSIDLFVPLTARSPPGRSGRTTGITGSLGQAHLATSKNQLYQYYHQDGQIRF